jgi:transposase
VPQASGDLIKIIWWVSHWSAIAPSERRSVRHRFENTGARRKQGACLFSKRLEKGRFVWPSAKEGKIALTPAQFAMLLEGIRRTSKQPGDCFPEASAGCPCAPGGL